MILLIPAILFTIYAQFKVSSETKRFLRVPTQMGYTGSQTARYILDSNGLSNVNVEVTRGHLSDHYDPRKRVVRLSEDIYYGNSIGSVAIAAHECGHAIQHANRYAPLQIRSSLVPIASFSSNVSWILIMAGFVFGGGGTLLYLGITLFAFAVLFQIVTLPVEFNASNRAIVQLVDMGIINNDEVRSSKKVLSAAALTYVAAALTSVLELVRLILIARGDD
jgi:Zn-dependent membrane protease YugP